MNTRPAAFTPERTDFERKFPEAQDTDIPGYTPPLGYASMFIVHNEPFETGETCQIAGRSMIIRRKSDYAEFQERCPDAPRLFRPAEYNFYVADPE